MFDLFPLNHTTPLLVQLYSELSDARHVTSQLRGRVARCGLGVEDVAVEGLKDGGKLVMNSGDSWLIDVI